MDKGIKTTDRFCGFELSRKSKPFLLSTQMLYTQVELGHPKLLSDKAHIKQSSLLQPQSFEPVVIHPSANETPSSSRSSHF
jgi:hypothetical protein